MRCSFASIYLRTIIFAWFLKNNRRGLQQAAINDSVMLKMGRKKKHFPVQGVIMESLTIDAKTFQAIKIPTETSNILLIQGGAGFLGCGYFSVETADKLGEAVAIVTGVACYEDMLKARVVLVSHKARTLGIRLGMSGKEALALLA